MPDTSTQKWYNFVPSLITTLNLICGTIGILFAINGKIQIAMILMFAGALFDFFDGFVARLLKVSSEFGKELDSLADLVTFGLLPGAMIFFVQKALLLNHAISIDKFTILQWVYFIIPIFIPVFSALRLAKFNIDVRQKDSFIGLPTPANAIFFASIAWVFTYMPIGIWHLINNSLILSFLIILFSYLLVSEIPLFSLKFKKLKGKENSIRFIFLFSSFWILLLLRIEGLPFVILLYILLSLIKPILVKIIYRP